MNRLLLISKSIFCLFITFSFSTSPLFAGSTECRNRFEIETDVHRISDYPIGGGHLHRTRNATGRISLSAPACGGRLKLEKSSMEIVGGYTHTHASGGKHVGDIEGTASATIAHGKLFLNSDCEPELRMWVNWQGSETKHVTHYKRDGGTTTRDDTGPWGIVMKVVVPVKDGYQTDPEHRIGHRGTETTIIHTLHVVHLCPLFEDRDSLRNMLPPAQFDRINCVICKLSDPEVDARVVRQWQTVNRPMTPNQAYKVIHRGIGLSDYREAFQACCKYYDDIKGFADCLATLDRQVKSVSGWLDSKSTLKGALSPGQIIIKDWISDQQENPQSIYSCYGQK